MEVLRHHIRHVLLWEFCQGNNLSTAVNKLCEIYGSDIISVSQGQRWFQHFRSENYSLENEPRPGHPQEFDDNLLQTMYMLCRI